MSDARTFLAFDLGASSGRAVLGTLHAGRVTLDELLRFDNGPVERAGRLHWDLDALVEHIKEGLRRANAAGARLDGLGIDTWGVDYGLLDGNDRLLHPPHHYRDPRTTGMMDRAFQVVPREAIFARTGIQFMPLNTLYQLLADRNAGDGRLDRAATLLFMPDLLNWRLTGLKRTDTTIASTSQCFDPVARRWAADLLTSLGLPTRIMPQAAEPATIVGPLLPPIAEQTGVGPVPVICPAGHDTACAVAAVPADGKDWAYISCGTWSLVGVELDQPILTPEALHAGVTNEIGAAGTIRLLRNVAGLWILEQCRRGWTDAGHVLGHDDLTRLAAQETPHRAFINPDDPRFASFSDMPQRIREFCAETGQPVPRTEAETARSVLESLALKYSLVLDRVARLTGRDFRCIHFVGGGSQNELLCQYTADACGRPVHAGPVEATALGNVLLQAMVVGAVESLDHLRAISRNSTSIRVFNPGDAAAWNKARTRFEAIVP
ncbi:MAG: L-Rhamnulokinase [Phycisphaerae bacterium]|nr:L-Rhamnulokinase [Phycisphaerae bacterium]